MSDGYFTIDDINSLGNNAFGNLSFVYLGACETGAGQANANNLVNAFYNKGADTVLGFTIEVNIAETNFWMENFMTNIAEGDTIQAAIAAADLAIFKDATLGNRKNYSVYSRYIAGNFNMAPAQ